VGTDAPAIIKTNPKESNLKGRKNFKSPSAKPKTAHTKREDPSGQYKETVTEKNQRPESRNIECPLAWAFSGGRELGMERGRSSDSGLRVKILAAVRSLDGNNGYPEMTLKGENYGYWRTCRIVHNPRQPSLSAKEQRGGG